MVHFNPISCDTSPTRGRPAVATDSPAADHWALRRVHAVLLSAGALLLIIAFADGLEYMVRKWDSPEYSYGFMLPVVAAFLVWRQQDVLRRIRSRGSPWGVVLVLLGALMFVAGELGSLYTVIQYGFLIALGGLTLSLLGARAFATLLTAYALLFFMVPLPSFLYNQLSEQLQLLSSQLGVGMIRLLGISVSLHGNLIDLGDYQLEVVEACSGLRYLFPLTAIAFIAASIFRGPLWQKVIVVLSAVPIAVIMNSFRIAVVGVLVQYGGTAMAEGFLHEFQGWVVFMASAAILAVEMALFARFGPLRLPLRDAFCIAGPQPVPAGTRLRYRGTPWSFWAALAVLLAIFGLSLALPARQERVPEPPDLLFFPRTFAEWSGERVPMQPAVARMLALDDQFLASYRNHVGDNVNLYLAYYASQRKGASAHSPKSCLPGGGWAMQERSTHAIPVPGRAAPMAVNRILIQQGDDRRLVYYWFDQRGRHLTNEFAVKWFLFWDALTRNRTDGALVRLTTPVPAGGTGADADAVLTAFAQSVAPALSRFIPD
jgi:exosortase D (VPLPA-CTERM-specific)